MITDGINEAHPYSKYAKNSQRKPVIVVSTHRGLSFCKTDKAGRNANVNKKFTYLEKIGSTFQRVFSTSLLLKLKNYEAVVVNSSFSYC